MRDKLSPQACVGPSRGPPHDSNGKSSIEPNSLGMTLQGHPRSLADQTVVSPATGRVTTGCFRGPPRSCGTGARDVLVPARPSLNSAGISDSEEGGGQEAGCSPSLLPEAESGKPV